MLPALCRGEELEHRVWMSNVLCVQRSGCSSTECSQSCCLVSVLLAEQPAEHCR